MKYTRARITFACWLSLALLFLGWGYSSRDILTIENGRLTLRQTSRWGAQSSLIQHNIQISSIEGRVAKNAPPTRSTRKFELVIIDTGGNPVPLPDSMRMSVWQINRSVKHFNQALKQGTYQTTGYPHVAFLFFGYISLFISLLYGLKSLKNE